MGIGNRSKYFVLVIVFTPSHQQIFVRKELKGQYHAIFSNTLKIEKTLFAWWQPKHSDKIPFKDYQNAKKLSTDIFAGRWPR